MLAQHNLPPPPYKKFFGREDSINSIYETLIEGGTYIASIDGVGGIGKTALAHYFCEERIIGSNNFDYLVWLSAKETVFDPFSESMPVKQIRGKFGGVEELINEVLSVTGLEEMINKSLDEKKDFVEKEIFEREKIFIVLDNLESVDDYQFFEYISKNFNKFASKNRNLKILTTSRKRKKIADFPIEIEGLRAEDALKMLKYLANEYKIKDILNSTDHDNIKLLERVGFIPLGIEFVIGQMSLGKSRGQIYEELQGYPSLEGVKPEERNKKLSDIILFSFKNMYETLDKEQQYVFKVITSLVRNKSKNDPPISFELLMSITDYSKSSLENAIQLLIDNKLIAQVDNEYTVTPMAINFVRQYYDDFGAIEDAVVEKKNTFVEKGYKVQDKVDLFLKSVEDLTNSNRLEDAERKLIEGLEVMVDHRIYFELAKVQLSLNKFIKAEDNFEHAIDLNPKDIRTWWEYINMEDKRGRKHIALQLSQRALEKTNSDISILLQRINILKYLREYSQIRKEVESYLEIYNREQRLDESLRLLRNWKDIEYKLVTSENFTPDYYFVAIEKLIDQETDLETKIRLAREALKIAKRENDKQQEEEFAKKIRVLEKKIYQNMDMRIKNLNKLFNSKNYDEAKKEARKILSWLQDDNKNIEYSKNALRVLLQVLLLEGELDRIIICFEDNREIGYQDKNCTDIYEKAKKEKRNQEKEKFISEIMVNIQNIELSLRKFVMWSLDYEDEKLIELVKSKDKENWIQQWQFTRDKSLKNDEELIHFSDLSHLRSLLTWVKPISLSKIESPSKKAETEETLKKIVAYLENYINSERHESFHSRLQLYEISELNAFLVDTQRTLDEVEKLMNEVELL